MAASLWFYMTPSKPKPSMHDVMTGYFVPDAVDLANNITGSFATTINIINGGIECGQGLGVNEAVQARASYFSSWLSYFLLPSEDNLDCGNQPDGFPMGGSSDISVSFTKDTDFANRCKVSDNFTAFLATAHDDYKRCVCEYWGEGASSCP